MSQKNNLSRLAKTKVYRYSKDTKTKPKGHDNTIRDRKYWEEMEEVWNNNLQELIEERKSKGRVV